MINSLPEIDIATDAIRWNKALKSAALETYTGESARKAGFGEVEIVGYSSNERNNKITSTRSKSFSTNPERAGAGATAVPAVCRRRGKVRPAQRRPERQCPHYPKGLRRLVRLLGPGGGGGGAAGPRGVRPLIRPEAAFLGRRGPFWSSPHDYQRSMMFDRDAYRAAWRAAAGPQGGEPPPHGYIDHDRREIVVYPPRVNVHVVRRPGPTRPPASMPRRLRAPTSSAATHPAPSGAGPRDMPAGPLRPGPTLM